MCKGLNGNWLGVSALIWKPAWLIATKTTTAKGPQLNLIAVLMLPYGELEAFR